METIDKVLVYLGPSLPLDKARAILPDAVYRPPAKQGDILSDVINFSPSHIILIDGEFAQNLSPWHKEIVYAIQYPGVKGIYGASSMGALRASELDFIGMIGIGQIYEWYRDGVTEDDSEVALHYAVRDRLYYPSSIPLVNIRAGVEYFEREFPGQEMAFRAREFLEAMQKIFYGDRTVQLCEEAWGGQGFPCIQQKAIDAAQALNEFALHEPEPKVRPSPDNLSAFFQALYDRDRRINVNGQEIPQQHIDSYVLLHNPEYERICWDSANQELALMLCNCLCVTVSLEEIERESQRFQGRCGIETMADFNAMLENNGWSKHEYDRLMIQNARIHKLQRAHAVSKAYRRNTQAIVDYLRTHQGFDYWAIQAAQLEAQIKAKAIDERLGINLEKTAWTMLAEHFEKEGLELKSLPEEYLLETGFSNQADLSVALMRISAAREKD
jgi:hypothetical protein